jgi:hypothetical protein
MEFHLRSPSFRRHNFCGPNTRLNERLKPDGTPKDWSKPINRVDEICKRHDIAYRNGDRCKADEAMLRELNELDDRDLSCGELLAKYCALFAIGIVRRFGMCCRLRNKRD